MTRKISAAAQAAAHSVATRLIHNRSAAINGFCCEGRCARDGKERARRLQRLFSGYERFREGRSAREGRSVRDARSDC